jgi:hypothetical protein
MFNEGNEPLTRKITLKGTGTVQKWDAVTGLISELAPSSVDAETTTLELTFEPWETLLLMVGENLKNTKEPK